MEYTGIEKRVTDRRVHQRRNEKSRTGTGTRRKDERRKIKIR